MIRHPEKGLCHISTSTTALYDGQHNFQGVLSLGRDVTSVEVLERRYQRARRWLIPSLVLLVVLTAGIFFGYPYFSKGYKITDIRKGELRDDLAVNYRLLRSLLIKPFEEGERAETTLALKGFLMFRRGLQSPISDWCYSTRIKRSLTSILLSREWMLRKWWAVVMLT